MYVHNIHYVSIFMSYVSFSSQVNLVVMDIFFAELAHRSIHPIQSEGFINVGITVICVKYFQSHG